MRHNARTRMTLPFTGALRLFQIPKQIPRFVQSGRPPNGVVCIAGQKMNKSLFQHIQAPSRQTRAEAPPSDAAR
jgi:hypothetical protein